MDCGFACFGGCLRDFMTRAVHLCALVSLLGGRLYLAIGVLRPRVLAVSWCAAAASLEKGRGAGAAQDAVLACYYAGQVKVAEMPLDTCRMMQALEWEDPAASAPCALSEPRRAQSALCSAPLSPLAMAMGSLYSPQLLCGRCCADPHYCRAT